HYAKSDRAMQPTRERVRNRRFVSLDEPWRYVIHEDGACCFEAQHQGNGGRTSIQMIYSRLMMASRSFWSGKGASNSTVERLRYTSLAPVISKTPAACTIAARAEFAGNSPL